MKTLTGFIFVLLGLSMFTALIYGGYYVVQTLWAYYVTLEFVVRIVLLSAMACILIAAIIIATAIKSSAKTTAIAPLTAEKLALYKKLIEISLGTNNATSQLEELRPDVVLVASSTVVEVYEKIVATTPVDAVAKSKLEGLYTQLVKSIRQDLGHKTAIGIPRSWHATGVKDEVNASKGLSQLSSF